MRQSSISKYFNREKNQEKDGNGKVANFERAKFEASNLFGGSTATESPEVVNDKNHVDETRGIRAQFSNILASVFDSGPSCEETIFVSNDEVVTSKKNYTPLEKQVQLLREKYSDSLLMIECGYRYYALLI